MERGGDGPARHESGPAFGSINQDLIPLMNRLDRGST